MRHGAHCVILWYLARLRAAAAAAVCGSVAAAPAALHCAIIGLLVAVPLYSVSATGTAAITGLLYMVLCCDRVLSA